MSIFFAIDCLSATITAAVSINVTTTTTIIASAALAIALTGSLAGCGGLVTPSDTPIAQHESGASSAATSARFVRVIDGDTIAVQPTGSLVDTGYGEHSVRLLGIDAPEMHKTTDQAPDCGAEAATEHLEELLARYD